MKKINAFYHFFICPDHRSEFWNWWLDEQLGVVERSCLHNIADINMCITMPAFWTEMRGFPFELDKVRIQTGSPVFCDFKTKVQEYLDIRFPFVNVLEYRDVSAPNLYEGTTLKRMWTYSKEHPGEVVCYFHNKGVMSLSPPVSCWRQLLMEVLVNQWSMRYADLEGHDVVGIQDVNYRVLSGNFFWATTDYIATLPEPVYENRYDYELWIFKNNPIIKYCLRTKADHFNELVVYGKNLHENIVPNP